MDKFELKIKDFGSIEEEIITAGGIDIKENIKLSNLKQKRDLLLFETF